MNCTNSARATKDSIEVNGKFFFFRDVSNIKVGF
jgi:hypothetical protein